MVTPTIMIKLERLAHSCVEHVFLYPWGVALADLNFAEAKMIILLLFLHPWLLFLCQTVRGGPIMIVVL